MAFSGRRVLMLMTARLPRDEVVVHCNDYGDDNDDDDAPRADDGDDDDNDDDEAGSKRSLTCL